MMRDTLFMAACVAGTVAAGLASAWLDRRGAGRPWFLRKSRKPFGGLKAVGKRGVQSWR
jgi:hypothetical protein